MHKCKQEGGTHLTGLEANLVLFAFDKMFKTNEQGLITDLDLLSHYLYTPEAAQKVRDKLFAAHEHPEERGE